MADQLKKETGSDPGQRHESADGLELEHLDVLNAEGGFDELEGVLDRLLAFVARSTD